MMERKCPECDGLDWIVVYNEDDTYYNWCMGCDFVR